MRKCIGLISLLSSSFVFAGAIPVDSFDQSKLEAVLRKIPSALVKVENHQGFSRKFYSYPKSPSGVHISCQADFYLNSTVPSTKSCVVEMKTTNLSGDEYQVTLTDSAVVSELRNALSYGMETKKFYSTERVYGQSFAGGYRDLFRYSFICETQSCLLTFASKEAP
jgi:hypothetical protein